MEGGAFGGRIGAEVQESVDRGLELLVGKWSNLILNYFMGGEAQSDEQVCVAHIIQYKRGVRGVRGVRELDDVGEDQSCALGALGDKSSSRN